MPKKGTKKAPKAAAVPRSARMNVNGTARKTARRTAKKSNVTRVELPEGVTNSQINAFKQKLNSEGYEFVKQLRRYVFYKPKRTSWSTEMAKYKRPVNKDPFEFSNMRSALGEIKGSPIKSPARSASRERSFESAMRSAERKAAESANRRRASNAAEQEDILRMLQGLGIRENEVKFNRGLPGGVGGRRKTRRS